MHAEQAFKLAYVRRLAEYGFTADEIDQLSTVGRIKQADGTLWDRLLRYTAPAAAGHAVAGPAGAAIAPAVDIAANTNLLPIVLGGSAAAAGGAGYVAGMAHDALNEQNPDEIKQRDIINRLSNATSQAEALNQLAARRRALASRKTHWRA